jgi:LDH2 family malate/lactate/ureidoglycolate dehydrogenase
MSNNQGLTTELMLITYPQLYTFTLQVFQSIGLAETAAHKVTTNLLRADLRGIDSHGVARLSGYVRLWKSGRININANMQVIHATPSTATIDADAGLGLLAGEIAMHKAIEMANIVGSGWVAVRNSNHFGIAGQYAMMALPHDMVGIAMTNASPLVAPSRAIERMLGTNPIAVAIPAGEEAPFVADFATTTAANGKLEMLQRKNLEAPIGWIQDAAGQISVDPHELKKGGALLPLGSDDDRAGHKGYCLGAWVDIFSGVLSGAGFGPWVPPFVHFLPLPQNPPGEGIGHFFGAMRIDGFQDKAHFKQNMDLWIRRFKSAKPIAEDRPVIIPGEIEAASEKHRLETGWEILPAVIDDLNTLADELKVERLAQ